METNQLEIKRKEWLTDYLAERSKENPQFSLRALSRESGISVAVLSRIMSGKRNFTTSLAQRIIENIKLTENELNNLRNLCHYSQSESGDTSGIKNYQLESFKAMSDWRHYALVKMLELNLFSEDSKKIGSILKTSELNVLLMIERLMYLDILQRDSSGRLCKTNQNLMIDTHLVEKANKILQKGIVEKMHTDFSSWIQSGDFNSMTLAINSKNIPEAKSEIKKFKRRMIEILTQGEKDMLVNFNMAICPID